MGNKCPKILQRLSVLKTTELVFYRPWNGADDYDIRPNIFLEPSLKRKPLTSHKGPKTKAHQKYLSIRGKALQKTFMDRYNTKDLLRKKDLSWRPYVETRRCQHRSKAFY